MNDVKEEYLKLKNIKNGVILFINNDNILFVRDIISKEWMLPGGHIEKTDESYYSGALREFSEETSYSIEPNKNRSIKSYIYNNKESLTSTIIFIIHSNQKLPKFNIYKTNGETDKVIYIPISLLKNHIYDSKNIGIIIKSYNINSFKELFNDNII